MTAIRRIGPRMLAAAAYVDGHEHCTKLAVAEHVVGPSYYVEVLS